MNILIPHTWLLEHLETDASPQEIQRLLSLSGPSVERIYEIEGESVYDIEVTTNRVDCMSVRGIAREAAVILSQAGVKARLKPANIKVSDSLVPKAKTPGLGLEIKNDPALCQRILCVLVRDVKRTPSPEWMQKRLRQIGVNVHDSVIDITNYVTHEYGHPCHAFDYDKLLQVGGTIIVKEAVKGKKFAIIDGTEYVTKGGEVVFENEAGEIIDLPAIKGTANTSINADTKNVLFWIECLDHQKVRFASMAHAIRTVAAQLEEKDLSPELANDTFWRGIELYGDLADGKVDYTSYTDIYPGKPHPTEIKLGLHRIQEYLGVEVPKERVKEILSTLGCEVEIHDSRLSVTPPLWRTDMSIPVDVIEEVARIYGYHHLPNTLMTGPIPTNRPTDVNFDTEHDARHLLAALGGQEVYTYSMISEALAKQEAEFVTSAFKAKTKEVDLTATHIKLKNPLTEDLTYLRRTLWSSHLQILNLNITRKDLLVFEFANTYIPPQAHDLAAGHSLPQEEYHLTLTSNADQRQVKGALQALTRSLYMPPLRYEPTPSPYEVLILAGSEKLGHLLRLPDPTYDKVTILDIDWKVLLRLARRYPEVKAIPKVAAIVEDMTFSLPKGVYTQQVIDAIGAADKLVAEVSVKDVYKDRVTFTISYQPESEMSAATLQPLRQQISTMLNAKFGAKLIGKLE